MIIHIGTKKIETERLILRKFTPSDAKDMYKNWASDDNVTKYLTWPAHDNITITEKILSEWISNYNNIEFYQWAIELKETSEVIGSISLVSIDNNNENCEIGYCIGKVFWNKGIVTEAFSALIDFLFNDIGFQRITGRHDIDNPASGIVMQKCGLKYEGTLRKIIKNSKGILVDCKYYSILKEEFQIKTQN
ncbi:GNAT family N-acetyltransferase [Clostridium sp. DL1XJH146]